MTSFLQAWLGLVPKTAGRPRSGGDGCGDCGLERLEHSRRGKARVWPGDVRQSAVGCQWAGGGIGICVPPHIPEWAEPARRSSAERCGDFDAPLVFHWEADGSVYYDMHAEPAGLGEEAVQSFKQDNGKGQTGSFHAPFTGIHGWFWENRSSRTVTVTLNAAGYFYASTVFRDGGDYERMIEAL